MFGDDLNDPMRRLEAYEQMISALLEDKIRLQEQLRVSYQAHASLHSACDDLRKQLAEDEDEDAIKEQP